MAFERRYLKKNPTQSLQWAYFQGFTPQNSWQNTRAARKKQHLKPLKIRPYAIKPIDIVLRRPAVTGIITGNHNKDQNKRSN